MSGIVIIIRIFSSTTDESHIKLSPILVAAVTQTVHAKKAVFWDVTPRGSRKNGPQLLVSANAVPSSLILFNLIMEAIPSSVASVGTRATRDHISEDGILHSHRRENLKSYIALTG
jgi:hypothetical protein